MKVNKIKLKNYMIIIFMLYITDTILFGTNYNQNLVLNAKISLVIFCIIYVIHSLLKYKLKFYKQEILLVYFPVGLIISSMFSNNDFAMGMILKALLIVCGYYIAKNIDSRDFFEVYTKIMVFLAAYSLVFFVLFFRELPFTNKVFNLLPIVKRNITYDNRFSNLIFTNIPIDNIPARARNWGIFWEPGAYSAYLNIALLILLFSDIEIEKKRKSLYILIIAVFTTFSTTGIISMVLILVAYLLKIGVDSVQYKKIIKKIILILPIVILLNSDISNKLFGKLNEGLSNVSFSSRWYSIIYNFRIFISNFFFGIGTSKYSQAYKMVIMDELGISIGNTNTIMLILAQYGFYVGGVFVYLIWRFSRKLGNEGIVTLIIFISLMLLLLMEDFTYSLFMNTLFFFGLQFPNLEKKDSDHIKRFNVKK